MRLTRNAFSLTAAALAVMLSSGSALAQSPPEGGQSNRAKFVEKFNAANTTHDGHLTLEQAQAGMPFVAKHFSAIDTQNKGYVTMQDIAGYIKTQRAARHQGNAPTGAPTNG